MGYEEKFLYCQSDKDTRLLLNMLKTRTHSDFKILEVLQLRRNWIAKYRNIEGIVVNGKQMPFTFTSMLEANNQDSYYRQNNWNLTDEDIATLKQGKVSKLLGEEQEHFFNKGDILIWVCGDRSETIDGYHIFGLAHAVENTLFNTMHDSDFPKQFLVDGKLDIVNALPYGCELAVDGMNSMCQLTDDEARVIKGVYTISLDGMPDIDNLLKTNLFQRKSI